MSVFVSGLSARFLVTREEMRRVSSLSARYLTVWNDADVEIRFTTTYVEVLATVFPDFTGANPGGGDMFLQELFPYNISYNSISAPTFADDVVVVDSGVSQRTSRWDQPLLEFDIAYGVRTMEQLQALIGFFRAVRGRMYGFLLYDPTDHTSSIATAFEARDAPAPHFTDQPLGVGNGVQTVFQMIKTYSTPAGSMTTQRPICKPIQGGYAIDPSGGRIPAYPVTIGVNGVQLTSGWSVDYTTGLVTFTSPPAGGATITAGYEFFVPVAFNTSRLSVSLDDYGVGKATDVKLIELRPSEAGL